MQRIALIVILSYAGTLLVMFGLQAQLIFPGHATQGQPAARVTPPAGCELVHLPTKHNANVTALFGPALTPDGQPHPNAAARPTILYFYGNGMCLAHALVEFDTFRRLGANVLIPDYLGYGLSEGKPGESACYATADACYDHLLTRKDTDPTRIVVAGWSLGGAVAIDLASRRPAAGLAVFSSFTSLPDVASGLVPLLPTRLLMTQRFESERKIPRVRCPILIGHGRADDIIPFTMSERLARAAQVEVATVFVDDASHNDFFDVDRRAVTAALRDLLDDSVKSIPPADARKIPPRRSSSLRASSSKPR